MRIDEILKPCPFCGNEVVLSRLDAAQGGITVIEVTCSCGAEVRFESDDFVCDWSGKCYQMGLTAIDKWNRRASDE